MPLAGLLSYTLRMGGRQPNKILMARATGAVHHMEFVPTYNKVGQLDKGEAVPYRLTRNLASFFSPFGVEGVFLGAMAAAAQVRQKPCKTLNPGRLLRLNPRPLFSCNCLHSVVCGLIL